MPSCVGPRRYFDDEEPESDSIGFAGWWATRGVCGHCGVDGHRAKDCPGLTATDHVVWQ